MTRTEPTERALAGVRVGLVGGGNMAEALVRGLIHVGAVEPSQVTVAEPRLDRLTFFRETFGVTATKDNLEAVCAHDIVILAVKPQILDQVMRQIGGSIAPSALVISLAAGVPMADIAAHLAPSVRICRTMPNICAVVGAAATALAPSANATDDDLAKARVIFEAVGSVVQVEENLMDAVTGLSGSGPAYMFLIIEALSDAGVRVGLPRYHAQALAAQTVLGSAKLLLETGLHPGVLKDQVTSPGGTAIAGLHTLEEGGLRTTLINAVVNATERSRQLGLKTPNKS